MMQFAGNPVKEKIAVALTHLIMYPVKRRLHRPGGNTERLKKQSPQTECDRSDHKHQIQKRKKFSPPRQRQRSILRFGTPDRSGDTFSGSGRQSVYYAVKTRPQRRGEQVILGAAAAFQFSKKFFLFAFLKKYHDLFHFYRRCPPPRGPP